MRCGWLRSVLGLRFLMPPAHSCNKCKTAPAAEGDSWCTGCTSWEFIGRELGGSWDSSGARLLASDLVVTTARQIRALRSLSAGLARQPPGNPPAGESRAKGSSVRTERESLPRRRHRPPHPLQVQRRKSCQKELISRNQRKKKRVQTTGHWKEEVGALRSQKVLHQESIEKDEKKQVRDGVKEDEILHIIVVENENEVDGVGRAIDEEADVIKDSTDWLIIPTCWFTGSRAASCGIFSHTREEF